MSMLTDRKAQAMTYDFFIAMIIFLFLLTLVISYWHYSAVQMEEINENNRATNALFLASEVWFKEGYPRYWEKTNILELGLSNDNMINRTKMEMLPDLGYSKVVFLLNLGTYNLQYTLYNSNNYMIFQFPSGEIPSSANNIYKIERIGILDEQPVKVRTIIWD